MERRPITAAALVLVALVGLGASASAAWRFADRLDLHVAAHAEGHAGAGVTVRWSGSAATD